MSPLLYFDFSRNIWEPTKRVLKNWWGFHLKSTLFTPWHYLNWPYMVRITLRFCILFIHEHHWKFEFEHVSFSQNISFEISANWYHLDTCRILIWVCYVIELWKSQHPKLTQILNQDQINERINTGHGRSNFDYLQWHFQLLTAKNVVLSWL